MSTAAGNHVSSKEGYGNNKALSQDEWEAQLSSIIERTNANLSVLSKNRKKQRPKKGGTNDQGSSTSLSKRKTPTLSAAWAPEVVPTSSSSSAEAIVEEVCERVAHRLEPASDERLRRLEDEVGELRARASQAVTSARLHESAVESLSRESQTRKSVAAKMLAWQADAEQWRSRVDATLETARARSKQVEKLQRSVSEALSRAASSTDLRAAVDEMTARSAAAVSAALQPVQTHVATELDKLKAQVARLGLGGSAEQESLTLAIESAVALATADIERRVEERLLARLGAKVAADIADKMSRTSSSRHHHEWTTDGGPPSPTAALVAGDQSDSATMTRVDRAVASLLARLEEARDDVRSLRETNDRRQDEVELRFRRTDRCLEEVREELDEKISAATQRAETTRSRLADEVGASKKRVEAAKATACATIDAKISEWRDDNAELRRAVSKMTKQAASLDEKIRVLKTSARAYAEDAPGVRRAAALAAKFEKVETRIEALDVKCQRIRDVEDRCGRDRARIERLERWKEADVAPRLLAAASSGDDDDGRGGSTCASGGGIVVATGGVQLRDVSQRLGRVEEWRDGLRDSLAKLTPARFDHLEETVEALATASAEARTTARESLRDADLALADLRDTLDAQLQALARAVDDCAETARRAADDAARATVTKRTDQPPSDMVLAGHDALERPQRISALAFVNDDDDVPLVERANADARDRLDALERRVRDLSAEPRVTRFAENLAALALRVDDVSAALNARRQSSPPRVDADARRILENVFDNAVRSKDPAPTTSGSMYAVDEDDDGDDDDDDDDVVERDPARESPPSAESAPPETSPENVVEKMEPVIVLEQPSIVELHAGDDDDDDAEDDSEEEEEDSEEDLEEYEEEEEEEEEVSPAAPRRKTSTENYLSRFRTRLAQPDAALSEESD